MNIIGKIIVALPEMTGTSKAGNPWKKREYVLETEETYPKKVHFDFFGERADQYPLSVGQRINLSFDIESREYNGRWFTSIRGWKAEQVDNAQTAAPQPMTGSADPFGAPFAPQAPTADLGTIPPAPIENMGGGSSDDLPF
jgi:hypothetical protein